MTSALSGQSGATTYTANDNVEYVGYYTPIGGTPFVLVTQAPLSVVYDNARNFFQLRVIIVGAGVIALLILLALILNQLTVPPLNSTATRDSSPVRWQFRHGRAGCQTR